MDKQKKIFPIKNNLVSNSNEKQVCYSCNKEIKSEISRIVVMRDIDRGPRLFIFHFFSPCWNFKLLCKKYPKLTLDWAGFSVPENFLMEKDDLRNLQKNLELWT